ncbi:peptidyl-prolyl cis-trans isomerase FKBP43 isoform X2 [Neltuma alba]|uniref:peptidyl-prolyl cis-trans isomerase FKBP43 isoform X2 n=1 Tax=Neltuma alba TaxID=207710 RepID=UPI0010A56C23|nr:peptidyl-prolyl cis-trans isomerase FKBP43-like isoform X2 [Prosopis alba]
MAFWGVEVRPGKSFTHKFDDLKGRLHISMATLGVGSVPAKSRLQLIGPRSIHLCGYYLGSGRRTNTIEESESYGEDIANTETDRSDCSGEDEYEDSFIDDDANPEVYPESRISSEEEVSHVNKRKGSRRRLQKKHQRVDSDDDSLPISSIYKSKASAKVLSEEMDVSDDGRQSDASHKNGEDDGNNAIKSNSKSKAGNGPLDAKTHRDVALPATVVGPVKSGGTKRKKKEQASKDSHFEDDNAYCREPKAQREAETDIAIPKVSEGENQDLLPNNKESGDNGTHDFPDGNQSGDGKMKKRRKKDKSQGDVEVNTSDMPQSTVNEDIKAVKKDEYIMADAKPSEVKTLPNGLVIQELEKGLEDGKVAALGRKISVLFTGKLKDNDEVFETNVGHAPYKFRLGKGQVIEGWDVGLEGMRMGGKRRLIIPPSMGFGSEGHDTKVPPNSWLVYDFELVKVR